MMRILYENFQIFQFRLRILAAETIHGNTVDILVRNSYQLRNSVDNFVFSSFFQVEVESSATRNPPPETSSPEETPPRVHRVSSTENITVSNPGVSEDFDIIVPTGNQIVPTGKSLSEALLFAEHGENILCTKNFLNDGNNFCTVHNMFSPGLSLEFS